MVVIVMISKILFMKEIFLYNTLSKKKEKFIPINENEIGLYTCGPTVYNYAHIGNLRTYIFEDILKRVLVYNGYRVKHVMNITDVGHLTGDRDMGEDKLEKGAKREGKSAWDIAKFYTDAFIKDLKALNIEIPKEKNMPRATDYIKQQIDIIKTLEEKGFTYKTSDGVYFDTSKFKNYNKLNHKDLNSLMEGARVEKNEEKKNPTDFALWKFSSPLPPSLRSAPSPAASQQERDVDKADKRQMEWWFEGKLSGQLVKDISDDKNNKQTVGFPGWHIECSAMSSALLGDNLDIHCGGIDHIDVHHTNEIAQSEAATGKKFFNLWMHGAFLNIQGGKKMAKSDGNFLTLENAFVKKGIDPMVYRFATVQTHYRKPMEYSEEVMKNAESGLKSLYLEAEKYLLSENNEKTIGDKGFQSYNEKFIEVINDDLNMPNALAIFWDALKSNINIFEKQAVIHGFDRVFGLRIAENIAQIKQDRNSIPEDIKKLVEERVQARIDKKWDISDKIRIEILGKGYKILDLDDNKYKIWKK